MSTTQASASERIAPKASEEREDRRGRRQQQGSQLTDKQIGKAAAYGRKITCRFFAQTAHEVTGYVVGMDDYHWMIATVIPESTRTDKDEPISLMLVHKSRVDVTVLHTESTLDNEDSEAQVAITQVGQKFWTYCENHYNGR